MINCKACNHELAKGVKKCPHCGKDQRNFFMKHKIFTGFIVMLIIGGSLGSNSGKEDITSNSAKDNNKIEQSTSQSVESKPQKVEERSDFKVGEVISYKKFDLLIHNQREIKSLVEDSTYTIFDFTITSKSDNFNFLGDIQGVTDGNEIIKETFAMVEGDLGDPIMTAFTKTLNNGQRATGYLAFDKKVNKIEIRSSLFSNDVINVIVD